MVAVADPSARSGGRDVLAQRIIPTLHRQRWSFEGAARGVLTRFVHLAQGRAESAHDEGTMILRPADVVWLPAGRGRDLTIEPGSSGVIVGVSDPLLSAAIGHHSDASALRRMTARPGHLAVTDVVTRDELLRALHAIEAESRRLSGGARHVQAAYLTIVLVLLLRQVGSDLPATSGLSVTAQRLRQFRQLVEAQLREHWTVARYAAELSITPDRLHDLCTRHLGRTPAELVHQRLAHEACLLLGGSDQSIEQLAADLGFGSPSHFSRFFKRWMTVGPKAYRDRMRRLDDAERAGVPTSYADWP